MLFKYINDYIHQDYITNKNSKGARGDDVFWPSQASFKDTTGKVHGCCLRQLFYNMKGFPITNPTSLPTIRKMEYGKKIEDYEVDMATKAGILKATQTSFELVHNNIKIRGKMDGIGIREQQTVGMEYKTSAGYTFKQKVWGTMYEAPMPKIPHLMQVMLYLDAFKDHPEYQFDTCYILYIERGECITTEFAVKLYNGHPMIDGTLISDLSLSNIYDRYHELHRFLTTNIMPSCDFKPYYDKETIIDMFNKKELSKTAYASQLKAGYGCNFECSYCEWLNKCREDQNIIL